MPKPVCIRCHKEMHDNSHFVMCDGCDADLGDAMHLLDIRVSRRPNPNPDGLILLQHVMQHVRNKWEAGSEIRRRLEPSVSSLPSSPEDVVTFLPNGCYDR